MANIFKCNYTINIFNRTILQILFTVPSFYCTNKTHYCEEHRFVSEKEPLKTISTKIRKMEERLVSALVPPHTATCTKNHFITAVTLMQLDELYEWGEIITYVKEKRLDVPTVVWELIFGFARTCRINFDISHDKNIYDTITKGYIEHEQYLAHNVNTNLLFVGRISYTSKFENFNICMEDCDDFWNWKLTIRRYKKIIKVNIPWGITTSYWAFRCPHSLVYRNISNEVAVVVRPNKVAKEKSNNDCSLCYNDPLVGAFRAKPCNVALRRGVKPAILRWRLQ